MLEHLAGAGATVKFGGRELRLRPVKLKDLGEIRNHYKIKVKGRDEQLRDMLTAILPLKKVDKDLFASSRDGIIRSFAEKAQDVEDGIPRSLLSDAMLNPEGVGLLVYLSCRDFHPDVLMSWCQEVAAEEDLSHIMKVMDVINGLDEDEDDGGEGGEGNGEIGGTSSGNSSPGA